MKFAHKVGKHVGHNETVCNLFDCIDQHFSIENTKSLKEIVNPIYKFIFDQTQNQTLVGTLFVFSNDHTKNKLNSIDPCLTYFYDNILYFEKNKTISLTEKYTSLCAYLHDYKQDLYIDENNPIIKIEIHHQDKFNLFKLNDLK